MSNYNIVSFLSSEGINDKRLPILPNDLGKLVSTGVKVCVNHGYGVGFGVLDQELLTLGVCVLSRLELLRSSDLIVVLKPSESDLENAKVQCTLLGWLHFLQNAGSLRLVVEKQMTVFSMEHMYFRKEAYAESHLFAKNNFYAGYFGLKHALSCFAGTPLSFAVIGYGNVSSGVLRCLSELGFEGAPGPVVLYSRHKIAKEKLHGFPQVLVTKRAASLFVDDKELLRDLLCSDVVINCLKQDALDPIFLLKKVDLPGSKVKLIVDLSCDKNIGFDFASPTSLSSPLRQIGNVHYYAVSNTPALAWKEATYSLSECLLPITTGLLSDFLDRRLERAVLGGMDVRQGALLNANLIEFFE